MRKLFDFSPNFSKGRRNKDIKFVIIHYTGMQSEIESIKRLKDPKFKLSSHYLINRKGDVIQMVKEKHIAWHAGKSKWKKFKNLNNSSIGIELVNNGHEFGYQSYTNKQINSLIKLCKKLMKKYNIKSENYLGHSDIAPFRKIDPGEKFPWKKLSLHKIGNWFQAKPVKFVSKTKKIEELFFKNLYKIGYRYFSITRRKKIDKYVVKAFQRRYLPNNVNGKIDKKTFKISYFLTH